MNHFASQRGVTLVELIVAITILGILAGVGIPKFQGLVERQQQNQALTDLYRLFQQARNSAITKRTMVTICPLDESESCTQDWNRPVHAFLDPLNERSLTSNTEIVYKIPVRSSGKLNARPSWKSYFQFRPTGTSHGTLGNITYCPASGNAKNAGRLLMNMGGRLRFAQDRNGDGFVQGSDGSRITCES